MKTLFIPAVVVAAFVLNVATPQTATPRTSGVYLTGADYRDGQLAFVGDCRSKGHKLELHDILNKPYIDVTHESEKRRYSKGELFGFRACDGRDYRFASNLEYQILEARDVYIYDRESVSRGKTFKTTREYYFSVGADDQIRPLTLENLKRALPGNHKFHDSLDATFGAGQSVAEYDGFHRMFKANWLLMVSRDELTQLQTLELYL